MLYDNSLGELRNLVGGVGAAIRNARAAATIDQVQLAFGDSSPSRLLTDADLDQLRSDLGTDLASGGDAVPISYEFFDANLGSGGASNRLFERSDSELVWVLNPDTVPTPTALTELIGSLEPDDVAAADARQVPIENPKGFDPRHRRRCVGRRFLPTDETNRSVGRWRLRPPLLPDVLR